MCPARSCANVVSSRKSVLIVPSLLLLHVTCTDFVTLSPVYLYCKGLELGQDSPQIMSSFRARMAEANCQFDVFREESYLAWVLSWLGCCLWVLSPRALLRGQTLNLGGRQLVCGAPSSLSAP